MWNKLFVNCELYILFIRKISNKCVCIHTREVIVYCGAVFYFLLNGQVKMA